MEKQTITLFELNNKVKTVITDNLPYHYWVKAEISELKVNQTGHCYLELVEKEEGSENIKAKARAIIWSTTFNMLKPYFETTTCQSFIAGIKVLIKVIPDFHELYGFSLTIKDIEPAYTVGELALQKQKTLKKLEEEGVLNMNKELPIPQLPQKIAVISSETAAGYGDFMNQLLANPFRYKFYIKLFPALMQGEKAEESVITAMEKVYKYEDLFDVLVIIRGGGAQSDLTCFNSYELAYYITQFPLPVLTGIGHEKDDTVADHVANMKLKTPTAVSEYLIDFMQEFETYLIDIQQRISERTLEIIQKNDDSLIEIAFDLKTITGKSLNQKENDLHLIKNDLLYVSGNYFNKRKHQIEVLEKKNHYLNPENILKRGFSITCKNNKVLKDSSQVQSDDIIETVLYKGKLKSKIE